jgi:hypothetical protein
MRTRTRLTRRRFGNAEPLVDVAQKALRIHARRAVKQANANLHRTLKPTYFSAIPLDAIYKAVESTGLEIDPEERQCILCGRDGRATWPLTYRHIQMPVRL